MENMPTEMQLNKAVMIFDVINEALLTDETIYHLPLDYFDDEQDRAVVEGVLNNNDKGLVISISQDNIVQW